MRRRRTFSAIAASPTMVGTLTVLVATLAVFLAYNANNGLPFVPSYRISVQVQDAAELVPGNEVRIGGVRVGAIESIEPVAHEDGSVTAKLDLKLDKTAAPLPADSTVLVRARSALGLKYLQIDPGQSTQELAEGSLLPLSAAHPQPVDLDQVLNTFNGPTRKAIRVNELEFGDSLAGRGPGLNSALVNLSAALDRLPAVARNLASPRTGLERFIRALAATASEVAPVAAVQAQMFVSLDTTFGALAEIARPFIQDTISRTPATLDAVTADLPEVRTFLRHSSALFTELLPGAQELAQVSPPLAATLEEGTPVLADSPQLNREIVPTAQALLDFSRDQAVRTGIDQLTAATAPAGPLLRFIAPAQSVCNYATILFENTASLLSSAAGSGGSAQRFIVFDIPTGPNNEGSPSSATANGPTDVKNYLHYNPYPNTASPGQTFECEAGNEDFLAGQQVIGNVPGNQGTQTKGQDVGNGGAG
jgi:virulence factor Mce-like protein